MTTLARRRLLQLERQGDTDLVRPGAHSSHREGHDCLLYTSDAADDDYTV